jgi:serine/threonine-protein kinase
MRDEPTQRSGARRTNPQWASAELSPGILIDKKFQLKASIGFGGMAQVILADDVVLGREVALKFLGRSLLSAPAWRERFAAEAKNMARVRHPNVMPVHSSGVHEGWPYFVMDYVAGGNLSEWLRVNPRPSVRFVVGLVEQIAAGLGAIHDAGLVHHDVKPANVLMGRDGRVVLADLGLSRLAVATESHVEHAGTPRYMAPEQAEQRQLPPELAWCTDVYQLGVTTLELLVGGVARDTANALSFGGNTVQADRRPSSFRTDVGPEIDRVIFTALATDPQARHRSVRAFAEALRDAATTGFARESPSPSSTPLRVLVADDDDELLDVCCRLLAQLLPMGTHIERASDGELALAALERARFDVLLLDLHMPRMGALDVAAKLAESGGPRPRLIAMTAAGGSDEWRALHALGVETLLLKPFDAEQLVAAVVRRPLSIQPEADDPASSE